MTRIEIDSKQADWLGADDPTPRYRRLADLLWDWVSSGRLAAGDAVPSERSLVRMTSLSRVTVRRALKHLVEAGVVEQRHGSGTFIRSCLPIEQPLRALTGFNEDMMARGHRPSSQWLLRSFEVTCEEPAAALGLDPGTRVARLHRLRLADEEPLAVELAVVPAALLPTSLDDIGASLYETIAAHGAVPVWAQQRMRAGQLPAFEAKTLGLPTGVPALYIERISRTASGQLVEFTRSWYRGDRYDFVAELVVRVPTHTHRRL